MKICHIVGDSAFGGGSKIVLQLSERAILEGHSVSVVATNEEFVCCLQAIGANAINLDCIRREIRPLDDLRGLFRLAECLRKNQFDLVQTHTSKAGVIGRVAAKLARVPSIVHTVHGFAFHEYSSKFVIFLVSSIERFAATMSNRIVTVSNCHREWALTLKIASPEKIVAIPNGIDPLSVPAEFDREAFRRSLGVGDTEMLVVSIGRLSSQKGFSYLLDAVAALPAHEPTCKFIIVGEGPMRRELEDSIARHELHDRLTLLGFRRDIAEFYAAADLIVQPSFREGLSISLLEAMAAGCPIITTSIKSNVEVIGNSEAAVLVPAMDSEALSQAIGQLLDDCPARDRMARTALSCFENDYTSSRMLDRYMELYRECDSSSKETGV